MNILGWTAIPSYGVQETYGGWFHVYAFTMTTGVILSIAASGIKLWIRKVPAWELLIGAVVIVPFSLVGASFFGKLHEDSPQDFLSLVNFSEPGMSIHGGVYLGTIVGLICFYAISFKTKVSLAVYMDCIIPNILLGQIIGRWGNFFNHEIPGFPIMQIDPNTGLGMNGETNPLSWLPNWLYTNLQFKFNGVIATSPIPNGFPPLISGGIYQMEPNFLYESFGLTMAWLIVTFLTPGMGRWTSKKPWKVNGEFKLDMKYSWRYFFTRQKEEGKLTYYQIWEATYYKSIDTASIEKYKDFLLQEQHKNYFIRKYKQGKALENANNPNKYKVTRCGVEGGIYFFLWSLVRLPLEMRKTPDDLFLRNDYAGSYATIIITMVGGLMFSALAQWVLPYFSRKPGIQYEKEYFSLINETPNPENGSKKLKEDKVKINNAKILKQEMKNKKAEEKFNRLTNK